jgi:hypothetical protein
MQHDGHGYTACTWIFRKDRTCRMEMDMQHRHGHGHAARTRICNYAYGLGYAAWLWTCTMDEVLIWLSYSGCPGLAVCFWFCSALRLWMYCSSRLVLAVLIGLSNFSRTVPGCLILAVLFRLSWFLHGLWWRLSTGSPWMSDIGYSW